MSYVLTDKKHYEDIADAIRIKNGSTETYKPEDMAEAVKQPSKFLKAVLERSLTEVQRADIDGVKELDEQSLARCRNLKRVDIKVDGLYLIGEEAFCYVPMSRFFLPKQITNISNYSFYYTANLKTFVVESNTPPTIGINIFGNGAMSKGTGTIYVPFGTLSAYQSATNWSKYADYMTEQAPIEVIAGLAGRVLDENGNDYDCTCVVFPSNTEEISYSMYDEAALSHSISPSFIYLNDGLKMITDYAFLGARITEIDIPSTVTYIGEFAFESYGNLKDVYIYCENPPYLGNGFGTVADGFTIHIPYGAIGKYQTATNWSQYYFVEDRKV